MKKGREGRIKAGLIRSSIRLKIPLSKQSEALEILSSVNARIQFDTGYVSSRIYRGVDDARVILAEEFWASDADVMRHLRSEVYRRVLLVIEMSEETPEIRFDTILNANGVCDLKPESKTERP